MLFFVTEESTQNNNLLKIYGKYSKFKLYRLLRLPEIFKDSVGISVYKFYNGQLHVVFSGFYTTATPVHAYDARTADNYCLINIKLSVWKHYM